MLKIKFAGRFWTSVAMMVFCLSGVTRSQDAAWSVPTCWYGISGGANFSMYDATVRSLNSSLTVPTAFNDGGGGGPYGSLFFEFRPVPMWGGMLNVSFDDRGGEFKDITSPSAMSLNTSISYIGIEPSLRFSPFSSWFYIFAGPAIDFAVKKAFTYKQSGNPDIEQDWGDVRDVLVFGQAGIGCDIPLTPKNQRTQVELSPFAAYLTPFGVEVRDKEDWSISTVRAGIALKIGMGKMIPAKSSLAPPKPAEVQFSIAAPQPIKLKCKERETLPIRNYVFFDDASSSIPPRYIMFTKKEALLFSEDSLLMLGSRDLVCRSPQELNVYYNLLNIVGDRMRRNPTSGISLIGASVKGIEEGKTIAGSIKTYLVDVFGIDGSRITVEGRTKPDVPSEKMGSRPEWAGLCRAEDRRVDIMSTSPELVMELGEKGTSMMNPVQIIAEDFDPVENQIAFNVTDPQEILTSWSLDVTEDNGIKQLYGPFTGNQASISGKTLLGTNMMGDYKVALIGHTKDSTVIKKESALHLERSTKETEEELKFSILFDFDKSSTVANYEKFLTDVVVPRLTPNSTVIIHGHTDIIGDKKYNGDLSLERANDVQNIMQKQVKTIALDVVQFKAFGYGSNETQAPFDNKLPEERCYNRTVIINIVPGAAEGK
jgi:outer membrane protein OmpA-like peptidoglycan-associated protein